MGGLLHWVERGGNWVGPQPAQAPPCVPNVTASMDNKFVRIISEHALRLDSQTGKS